MRHHVKYFCTFIHDYSSESAFLSHLSQQLQIFTPSASSSMIHQFIIISDSSLRPPSSSSSSSSDHVATVQWSTFIRGGR
jgi:hypothetical protein